MKDDCSICMQSLFVNIEEEENNNNNINVQ